MITRTPETLNHHLLYPFLNLSALSTIGWCPESFVMTSLTVKELSCWQTDGDVWAYQGVFRDGRFNGTMENVVGPTLDRDRATVFETIHLKVHFDKESLSTQGWQLARRLLIDVVHHIPTKHLAFCVFARKIKYKCVSNSNSKYKYIF